MISGMRRIVLLTEYDGSLFKGWQMQPSGRTIQRVLQQTLAGLTAATDLTVYGCSRTDAGVHARGHVSHFITHSTIPAERFPLALNSKLPDDLIVKAACEVDDSFHARHSAHGKRYSYTYWNHSMRPVIGRQFKSHVPGSVNIEDMKQAMPYFLGEQDFSALMDQNGNKTNISWRRIDALGLRVDGPQIELTVEGSGFLYHMVRIIAGTLLAVGQGKIRPDDIPQLLLSHDRRKVGKTMPASGLCLEYVLYDPPIFADIIKPAKKEGDFYVQFNTLE